MADAKEAIGATARIFWLYQAVALAASLLAFLPDRSSTYTDAINELRRLEAIQIRPNDVDTAIAKSAYAASGREIFSIIRTVAAARQIAVADTVQGTSTYFWVDSGPQSLDFANTKVRDLLDALQAYKSNPRYTIFTAKPDSFRTQLGAKLAGRIGAITSVSIPCNYAPQRCRAEVSINPKGDDTGAEDIVEFYVPRVATTLEFGVKDLIDGKYHYLKDNWLEAPALSRVQDEVAELEPAQAIAKLQEMRKAEEKPLSVFDVSFSGSMARLIAPVMLALLAFAAWASATGLARIKPSTADIAATIFLPLIDTVHAAILRAVLFAFPIAVGEGLFLRAWAGGTGSGLISLVSIVVQSIAAIGIYRIFATMRAGHGATGYGDRARTVLIFSTTLACGVWLLMHHHAASAGPPVHPPAITPPQADRSPVRPKAETDAEEKEIRDLQRREAGGE